ncbi:MAG: reverse transcriptase/maturase family protein [Nitrospira sp.]
MNKQHFFQEIGFLEKLFLAWNEFVKGKKNKRDVAEFSLRLSENIFVLYEDLKNKSYTHASYHAFNISDPKPRNIHKASVRDRLLHHAIYRVLYPYFDIKFIHDSYSCRKHKGTHSAMNRFRTFTRKVSKNNTKQCFILKCDVRKFFASIDHKTLMNILKYHKLDRDTLWLLNQLISSFNSTKVGKGLPLGNLTSQLLVNIYMNEFDQYVKHRLNQKYYIRYADDFVVMGTDRTELEKALVQIKFFLKDNLLLDLHPDKVFIKTYSSGVDFLGWVNFPTHRVLRTVTKKRMFQNLKSNPKPETLQSYLGLLSHGNTRKLKNQVINM